VWQYESFNYLSVSNICQAAYHANVFTIETYKFQSVLFKRTQASVSRWPLNETKVISNGIGTLLWPPSGLKMSDFLENKFEMFHFRHRLNFTQSNIFAKDFSKNFTKYDVLVLVRAVHIVKSKKTFHPNSLNVRIYYFNKTRKENSDFEFYLKRLIPHDESFVSYRKYIKTKIANRTFTKINENLTQIDLNLMINYYDQLKMLNNYFEVFDANSNETILKFPLNFASKILFNSSSYSHTIRLARNQTQVLSLLDNDYDHECKWHLMNVDLDIACKNNLILEYDSRIKDQNFIIYPHRHKLSLNVLSRVIALEDGDFKINCLNGGVFRDDKCLCLPGFIGDQCEKKCPLGHFGEFCTIKCPNSECEGYLVCGKDSLGCSCLSGYKGFACSQPCAKNEWGPECNLKCDISCLSNSCDRFSGDCICSTNFNGI
jgi:hypothetical protein